MDSRLGKFSRLKKNFATYHALRNGVYDNAFCNFLEKLEDDAGKGPVTVMMKVPEDAIAAQIRDMMAEQEWQLADIIERLSYGLRDAESCNDALMDISVYTKWRLGFDLIASSIFGFIGVVGFIAKCKAAGIVGLLAALSYLLTFLDELDIRRVELNDQLEDLESICDNIKSDLAEYNVREINHNFIEKIMVERFGKGFMSDNPDPDDLMETFNPDIDPSEYYYSE